MVLGLDGGHQCSSDRSARLRFPLAGIGWLPWLGAAASVPFFGLLFGLGLGFFNPLRTANEYALVSTALSSCLFLLVLAQYAISIVVTNCFDDHAAVFGSIGALTGGIILMLGLWTGALGGAQLRGRLTSTRG